MEMLAIIVGYVIIVCLTLGVTAWLISFLLDSLLKIKENFSYVERVAARKNLAKDIMQYSYWMSEDVRTVETLKCLGKHILDNHDGLYDPQKFRDSWRNIERKEN